MNYQLHQPGNAQENIVTNVSIQGEAFLNDGLQTIPWKTIFTLNVEGRISGKPWRQEIPYVHLEHRKHPFDKLTIIFHKNTSDALSISLSVTVDPNHCDRIPPDVTIDFYLKENDTTTTMIGRHRLKVRIPIRDIPVRNNDFDVNDLFRDLYLSEYSKDRQSIYAYKDMFDEVKKHLKKCLDIPIDKLIPAIWWIQGGIGCGKSTLIHQLLGLLKTTTDWCVVDLTGYPYEPPNVDILHKRIFDCLSKCIGDEEGNHGQPSPQAYSGANDYRFQKHIARCYSQIRQQGYKGILYIFDEFDTLWPPPVGDCEANFVNRSISVGDFLKRLLWIMSIVPDPTAENMPETLGAIPSILLISDQLLPEERIGSSFGNDFASDCANFILQPDGASITIPFEHRVFELNGAFDYNAIQKMLLNLLPPFKCADQEDEREGLADRIYVWTRGHPACVKLLLYKYFSYCKELASEPWPSLAQIIEQERYTLYENIKYITESKDADAVGYSPSVQNSGQAGSIDQRSPARTVKIPRLNKEENEEMENLKRERTSNSSYSMELLKRKGIVNSSGKIYNLLFRLGPKPL